MAGTLCGLLLAAVLLVAVAPASAKDYTVGESSGWTTGVDYRAWTNGKTFHTGDNLLFKYAMGHSVIEVSAADHGACSTGNPLRSYTDQSTTVSLTRPGTRYFICGTSGHCASGMKLAVTVVSGSRDDISPAAATTSSSSRSTMLSAKPTGNNEPSSGTETETTSAAATADTTMAAPGSSKLNSIASGAGGSEARTVTVLLLVAAGFSGLVC